MKFKCKVCNGTGLIQNPYFEVCANDKELGVKEGDCNHCPEVVKRACKEGEFTTCHNCGGKGYLIIDEDVWKLVEPIKVDFLRRRY